MRTPSYKLVRKKDPDTSKQAAATAAASSPRVEMLVWQVVTDGRPRIDQEIHADFRALGGRHTLSRIQHVRKAFSDAGVLRETRTPRNTKDGSSAREWVWDPQAYQRFLAQGLTLSDLMRIYPNQPKAEELDEAQSWLENAANYYSVQHPHDLGPKVVVKTLKWLRNLADYKAEKSKHKAKQGVP